jgi:hypothetical protein
MAGRSGNRGRAILFLALLTSLRPFAFADDSQDAFRTKLSAASVRAALAYADSGKKEEAIAALEEALRYDGGNSDAAYELALLLGRGERRLALLEQAVDSSAFSAFSKSEAAIALAETLADRGEGSRIEGLIGGMEYGSARAALVLAKAAYLSGDRQKYEQRLYSALKRFPDDSRLVRYWLERSQSMTRSSFDDSMLKIAAPRWAGYGRQDPDILILASRFAGTKEERLDLLKAARASGDSSRLAIIAYLEAGLIDESEAVDSFFSANGRDPLFDELVALASALPTPKGRLALADTIEVFSSGLAADANGDGIADGIASYADGELSAFDSDPDQDGETELSVAFRDGLPSVVTARGLSLSYGRYPELESIQFDSQGYATRYDLAGGSFSLPLISFKRALSEEGIQGFYIPELDPRYALPVEAQAAIKAVTITRKSAGGPDGEIFISYVENGIALRSEAYAGRILRETIEFSRGVPVKAVRDRDGDGRFETRVFYLPADGTRGIGFPGLESAMEIDANGDGVPEFREDFLPRSLKRWDYDANGLWDASESIEAGGRKITSFSSRLDGVLDVVLVFTQEGLASVKKNGKVATVVKEKGSPVSWIGSKPFDLGSLAPRGDGLYERGGKRYIIHWVGETAYAEAVN